MPYDWMPIATAYDSSDDPPGGIDPLGTVPGAEQLAEILFAGVTARMWRARHLTFTALASLVAGRAAGKSSDHETVRLEARLGLERLFVSAIARKLKDRDAQDFRIAAKRLPGIELARSAIASGDQPLGKHTFLKGQAINGPFGVVARLARNLDIIDQENRLSRGGEELLLAWSAEQNLPGVLDESSSRSPGSLWLANLVGHVVKHSTQNWWPSSSWAGWADLAERLRPDQFGKRESAVIYRFLAGERTETRRRCLSLMEHKDTLAIYAKQSGAKGELDKMVLIHGLQKKLGPGVIDRHIDRVIGLIDAYEDVGGLLETAMRGILWALTHQGGQAGVDELLANPTLKPLLRRASSQLKSASKSFEKRLDAFLVAAPTGGDVDESRLRQIHADAQGGAEGISELIETVMARHERVQRQKRKGVWVERDAQRWTLVPGFGNSDELPPVFDGAYLHPFRVSNAYSLLRDLGRIPNNLSVSDGEQN